eukprot:1168522-Amphidinium_carterae.3
MSDALRALHDGAAHREIVVECLSFVLLAKFSLLIFSLEGSAKSRAKAVIKAFMTDPAQTTLEMQDLSAGQASLAHDLDTV